MLWTYNRLCNPSSSIEHQWVAQRHLFQLESFKFKHLQIVYMAFVKKLGK